MLFVFSCLGRVLGLCGDVVCLTVHQKRRQTLCFFKIFISAGWMEILFVWRSSVSIWERRSPSFFGREVLGAPFGRSPAHLFFI